jgi:hypothetical protein
VFDGQGVHESSNTLLRTEAELTFSVADLGTSLTKVIDEWTVTHAPLNSGMSVSLEISMNEGLAWFEIATNSTGGSTTTAGPVGFEGATVQARIVLTGDGTTTPVIRSSSLKLHPLTITDDILELPINCGNELEGLNGMLIEPQVAATVRMRQLEALGGTRVRLQDIDWPVTGLSEIWEVVSVDTTSVGIFDRSQSRRTESGAVAVLTLRRGS